MITIEQLKKERDDALEALNKIDALVDRIASDRKYTRSEAVEDLRAVLDV